MPWTLKTVAIATRARMVAAETVAMATKSPKQQLSQSSIINN
jgi:hypothetical protein